MTIKEFVARMRYFSKQSVQPPGATAVVSNLPARDEGPRPLYTIRFEGGLRVKEFDVSRVKLRITVMP